MIEQFDPEPNLNTSAQPALHLADKLRLGIGAILITPAIGAEALPHASTSLKLGAAALLTTIGMNISEVAWRQRKLLQASTQDLA